MSAHDLRRELALTLYAQQRLSLGKARELAGLTLWEFRQWLGLRRIEAHYDADDLQDDLATLRGAGPPAVTVPVSNTSPLTNLAAIGQFDLLRALYGQLLVAEAVWEELNAGGRAWPGREEVAERLGSHGGRWRIARW
ncbi:MAG: UPF0175 family protein [Chromatiales bacterium]|nr:UPF0175 family protein [Chromatiales bacterium]